MMSTSDRPSPSSTPAPPSVAPAQAAFADEFPDAELWHLLDDRLVMDADAAGGLTPALRDRMSTLIQYAVDGGADAVQLSCSMYGPVAVDAQRPQPRARCWPRTRRCSTTSRRCARSSVGVLGSLESAAADSAERLAAALARRHGLDVRIETVVVDGAAAGRERR